MLDSPGLRQRGEHDVAKLSQKGKAERNGGEGWRRRMRRGVEDSRRREKSELESTMLQFFRPLSSRDQLQECLQEDAAPSLPLFLSSLLFLYNFMMRGW
ncbi:hypothetical protein Q8A67_018637 [Cirrhinus molitorella]|uniref:Uncharacterized protein n=1 Tax=Cirrhinus molitorella TaxID=172907 RepID=A0AA88TJ71_9TELE|nr:hypothetical protein Q8A67_018637 [Cirrhinus molitorella]